MLLDDDDADEEGDADLEEESETEVDDRDVAGYVSVSLFHHVSFIFSYVRVLIGILSILSGSVWKMLT